MPQHKDDPMFAEFLETHGKTVDELVKDDDESDQEESDEKLAKQDEESDGEEDKEANKGISDLDVNLHFHSYIWIN